MTLLEKLIATYPELSDDTVFIDGTIVLQDDTDELGAYIAKWNYSKPIPNGLKLGK